jgi:hypothetical protein
MERVHARGVCGHIEHPVDGLPDLRKFAVVLTDVGFYEDMRSKYPAETERMQIDTPANAVVGRFEALSTPDGKIVEALWIDEVQTGSSSRAQGNVVTNEGRNYPQFPEGVDIVLDDVDEETLVWDIVARPSTPGAFPERVREAIQEAIQEYQREALQETQPPVAVNPPIGQGLGESTMNSSLSDVRARLSRVKPLMENLDRQPRRNLLSHLKEIDSLQESLQSASKTLNESQEFPAAEMRGDLQALRDKVMSYIGAAFNEAEGSKLPGATAMKVADKTTSNMAALNSDPHLNYPSSQSLLPGGRAGAGAVQEPDKGTSDQSVPGPGVTGGDSKLASDQSEEERRKQQHGQMDGDPGPGSGGGSVSGKSVSGKAGTKGESITTDQAHSTGKGELGQEVVKTKEEGDGMEVDDFGRPMPSPSLKAGKTGSEDGSKLQGIVASQQSSGAGLSEGDQAVNDQTLANLNTELVAECRQLRAEVAHFRAKAETANALVTETGQKFRKQRFKMAMERLIENNPMLDDVRCRAVLETSRDETHMVQMAEALLGTRARISSAAEEKTLSIQVESDGFYRLYIDGKPHNRVFDGGSLYERLSKMGVPDPEIHAEFDRAHGINEMEYKLPDELGGDMVGGEEGEEGMDYEVVALVPLEPVDAEGGLGDEGDLGDLGDVTGLEDEGEEMDLDYEVEGGEEEEEMDYEEPVEEADYARRERMSKASREISAAEKGKVSEGHKRFAAYAESRRVRRPINRQALTESRRRKSKRPVAGARRMSEALPTAGSTPSRRPPKMAGQSTPPAEMSLTERVIARKRQDKKNLNG